MQPYHYTECGLDNVYLLNGYTLVEKDGRQTVALADEEDGDESFVDNAIGLSIASWNNMRPLTGAQIRFLMKDVFFIRGDIDSDSLWLKILRTSPEQLTRWLDSEETMPYEKEVILRLKYIEGRVSSLTHQMYVGQMVENLGRYRPDHHPADPAPNLYLEWKDGPHGAKWKRKTDL